MNEKGLVMNGLYLAESDYGKPDGRKCEPLSRQRLGAELTGLGFAKWKLCGLIRYGICNLQLDVLAFLSDKLEKILCSYRHLALASRRTGSHRNTQPTLTLSAPLSRASRA